MALKQNDTIETIVCDYGFSGEGIAKHQGVVIFIPYALKGEKVLVKINHIKKNYAHASLIEVLQKSPSRINPECNRFLRCGGCNFSHMDYYHQLAVKKEALINTLKKNTGRELFVQDVIASPKEYAYRNKAQLPFGIINDKVALGFFREGSHKIVSITKCFLHDEWLEQLIKIVLDFANSNNLSVYNEQTKKGLLRHLVARYIDNKLCVVLVVNASRIDCINKLSQSLKNIFNNVSLYLSINKQDTNVIMGQELIPIIDKPFVINILGIEAQVNALSFLQVNNEIRDIIYKRVIDHTINSDIVIDVYSGIGILSAVLAKNGVKEVYNIEIIPEAIDNAKQLVAKNNINNITNICGDAAKELPKLINDIIDNQIDHSDNPRKAISIILDPPRKGVNIAVIEALRNINHPIDLIYISCNPATLSRDLALLTENDNYVINSITAFDMFPQTKHLETLVCLSRKV